ncbi:hypothetical protein [Escherichia phage JB01]|uniref:Bacteriophage T7 tail fibre protein-like N-terminal domain-containing protein n=1 Tax=Escherichia phage JB01 TaxID=2744409 RepID=A0A7S6R7F9_9CAUD|nr:hypothetical protein [Escherichia phage JB01]
MANVIKTVLTYQLDGSNRDFNIPFEYLARKFVVVTLIGVDRKVLTINTDYRFATRTTISLTKAWGPADGYTTIELRRVTSTTDRLVDFTDGSILRAYDLNVAQIQTMHVAEEARDLTADTIGVNNDGHLDARGRRIVNLANAVDDRDAVPFGQLKTMNQNSWQARNEALQFRNEAETFRNQAEGFKNESGTNAANTKQWRDETQGFRDGAEQLKNTAGQYATSAGNSATAAHQSEVNAENSATASANSAHLAEQQADRAEREADKLGNWNALAGTVESVQGDSVFWKGGGYWVGGPAYRLPTNHAFRFRMGIWEEGDFLKSDFAMDRPDGIGFIGYAADKTGQHRHQIRLNQLTIAGGVVESDADGLIAHAFADQYTTKAPFFQQIHVQSTSSYHPIIKQRTYQSGRWAGCWSIGTLLTGAHPSFHIHMKDEGISDKLWTFNTNGDFRAPGEIWADGGRVAVRNGSFDPEGRVWGTAYDTGYLDDWIRRHWPGDVYWGPQRWVQKWGGYADIVAGAGEACSGVTADGSGNVAGAFFRALWLGYHNGTKRLVASQ